MFYLRCTLCGEDIVTSLHDRVGTVSSGTQMLTGSTHSPVHSRFDSHQVAGFNYAHISGFIL